MLTRELLSQTLPYLHLQDKVYQALQMMNDNHVTHLPIVDGDKYIGLISKMIYYKQKMIIHQLNHWNRLLQQLPSKKKNIF